jgi:hypothetical protein
VYDANIIVVSLFFAKRNRGSDGWDARGDDDKVLFRTVGHHLVKPKSRVHLWENILCPYI